MTMDRKPNKRRYTCRDRVPSSCAGEGHNGAIGRSKWKQIAKRRLRRVENQEQVFSTMPHRSMLLRYNGRVTRLLARDEEVLEPTSAEDTVCDVLEED